MPSRASYPFVGQDSLFYIYTYIFVQCNNKKKILASYFSTGCCCKHECDFEWLGWLTQSSAAVLVIKLLVHVLLSLLVGFKLLKLGNLKFKKACILLDWDLVAVHDIWVQWTELVMFEEPVCDDFSFVKWCVILLWYSFGTKIWCTLQSVMLFCRPWLYWVVIWAPVA